MKTSELTGTALDWAVAKCEGIDLFETERWIYMDGTRAVFRPSTDWRQGGPIIERHKIDLFVAGDEWGASLNSGGFCQSGSTPLIAAMRCFVGSRLGDEVKIPDILGETR